MFFFVHHGSPWCFIPTANSPVRILFRHCRGCSPEFNVIELLLLMNNYLSDLSRSFNNFLNLPTIQKEEFLFLEKIRFVSSRKHFTHIPFLKIFPKKILFSLCAKSIFQKIIFFGENGKTFQQ